MGKQMGKISNVAITAAYRRWNAELSSPFGIGQHKRPRGSGREGHMKWILVAVLVAGVVGATTKPSTAPALTDTRPLRDKMVQAQAELDKAKVAAKERWESSDECKSLTADLNEKRSARDRAKAGDNPQAKLDAAKAYNDARIALEAATAKGLAGGEEIIDAAKVLRLAADALAQAERHNAEMTAEANARDPIKQGIQNHRPVLGMTKDEMGRALAFNGKFNRGSMVRETEELQLYDFSYYMPRSGERTGYLVWFRDGKAVEIIAP